ncbi:putative UDP-glycosyltransferases domain-containing protein [Seiridium cardinale]|uniref:UDP-glycosyltransferases domain-containing protein n=1 Tax=Seiridium cardinale TaxID=138064 RepID=A0ABR2XEB0_9PEZI
MEYRYRDRLCQALAPEASKYPTKQQYHIIAPQEARADRSRTVIIRTILVALITVFITWQWVLMSTEYPPLLRGQDNTVLFLAHAEPGQINVQLATIQALVESHPQLKIHIASFPAAADKISRVSTFALAKTPSAHNITFHSLPGPDRLTALHHKLGCDGRSVDECMSHPPGARGAGILSRQLEAAVISWNGEDHFAIYQKVIEMVDQIDPAVVVLDFLLRPGLDAVRHLNRLHILMSPNALADLAGPIQPYGAGFWKYPAMGTGFTFPVPWRQVPENMYINLRLLYHMLSTPLSRDALSYLQKKGVKPIEMLDLRPDVPFISQTLPGAGLPVEKLPTNMTAVGALLLDSAPAVEQQPELIGKPNPKLYTFIGTLGVPHLIQLAVFSSITEQIHTSSSNARMGPHGERRISNTGQYIKLIVLDELEWTQKAPTVFINLGSLFKYSEARARDMALAIEGLLQALDIQVLWKMAPHTEFGDAYLLPLKNAIEQDRVKVFKWLPIDTLSLLETENVVAFIHHGGSSSYNEAVVAGVPQVVIPLWEDHYNFAQLAEDLGIGIYACRQTVPQWTIGDLTDAFIKVLDSKEASMKMRETARRIGQAARSRPGRQVAAELIARMAIPGYQWL